MKPQTLIATILLTLTLGVTTWGQPAPSMTAHFINIGQGQSILLEFSCGAVLIDAGAQDDAAKVRLVSYLNTFFTRRKDLHRTLNTILITHDHIDHDAALRTVVENFKVEHFVDNGLMTGPGAPNPTWLRKEVATHHRTTAIEEVAESEIDGLADKTGFTDEAIDPIRCEGVDPEIHVLRARIAPNPGWSVDAFGNLNNHSLVTRVDFNGASLLFLGDLEEPGIEGLLNYYTGEAAKMLDVDVIQVGHHGSHNATTKALL